MIKIFATKSLLLFFIFNIALLGISAFLKIDSLAYLDDQDGIHTYYYQKGDLSIEEYNEYLNTKRKKIINRLNIFDMLKRLSQICLVLTILIFIFKQFKIVKFLSK